MPEQQHLNLGHDATNGQAAADVALLQAHDGYDNAAVLAVQAAAVVTAEPQCLGRQALLHAHSAPLRSMRHL